MRPEALEQAGDAPEERPVDDAQERGVLHDGGEVGQGDDGGEPLPGDLLDVGGVIDHDLPVVELEAEGVRGGGEWDDAAAARREGLKDGFDVPIANGTDVGDGDSEGGEAPGEEGAVTPESVVEEDALDVGAAAGGVGAASGELRDGPDGVVVVRAHSGAEGNEANDGVDEAVEADEGGACGRRGGEGMESASGDVSAGSHGGERSVDAGTGEGA